MPESFAKLIEASPPPFWDYPLLPPPEDTLREHLFLREMYRENQCMLDLSSVLGVQFPYCNRTWGAAFQLLMRTPEHPALEALRTQPGFFMRDGSKPVRAISPDNGRTSYILKGGEWVILARFLFHRAGIRRGFGPLSRDTWITDLPVEQKIRAINAMGFSVRLDRREIIDKASTATGTRHTLKSHWRVDGKVLTREALLDWKPGNRWLRALLGRKPT